MITFGFKFRIPRPLGTLLQGGGPLPGPDFGLLSDTELSCPRRHMGWQNERLHWRRTPGWRAAGSRSPGELLCHVAHGLGFPPDGISFQVVYDQSFWLRSVLDHAVPARAKVDARAGGSGRPRHLFLTFPSSSHWWWLISSVFTSRTSWRKRTHAAGACGAGRGAVSSTRSPSGPTLDGGQSRPPAPLAVLHWLWGRGEPGSVAWVSSSPAPGSVQRPVGVRTPQPACPGSVHSWGCGCPVSWASGPGEEARTSTEQSLELLGWEIPGSYLFFSMERMLL